MSDKLCLPKTHLLIILCVFMGLTVWYIHFNQKKQSEYNQLLLNNISQISKQNPIDKKNEDPIIVKNEDPIIVKNNDPIIVKNEDVSFLEKRKILEYRDAEVKYNDFKPPERRVPEYQYPVQAVKQIINIPTRGYPDNYQLMGVLLRDNTETAFNLFGRQTYPGSNQYEYYAQGTMHNNNVKLPINRKDNRELYDGDQVKIPGTDENKGQFKVKLYNLDVPRYNPYQY
jgi:hypothetical protein